jgi:hypothetical protein
MTHLIPTKSFGKVKLVLIPNRVHGASYQQTVRLYVKKELFEGEERGNKADILPTLIEQAERAFPGFRQDFDESCRAYTPQ